MTGRSSWDRRGSTQLAMIGVGIMVQTVIAVVWGARFTDLGPFRAVSHGVLARQATL